MSRLLLLFPFTLGVVAALVVHVRTTPSADDSTTVSPTVQKHAAPGDAVTPNSFDTTTAPEGSTDPAVMTISQLPIDGVVVDSAGQPLGDVLIELTPRTNRGPYPQGESLEQRLQRLVDQDRWHSQRSRETFTEPDGSFRFDHLEADLVYAAKATAPGLRLIGRPRTDRLHPGVTVEFVGTAVCAIPVQVILPDGSEPTRAQLSFSSGGRNSRATWTPDQRIVELEAGNYVCTAQSDPWYESASIPFQVNPEDTERRVISLIEPAGLVVRFLGTETLPRGSWRFDTRCVRLGGDLRPKLETGTRGRSRGNVVSFLGLEPGRYLVGFPLPWCEEFASEVVVGDELTEVELTVPPPPPGDLTVWVYEADRLISDPRATVGFNVVAETERGSSSTSPGRHRLGDGSYALYFDAELEKRVATPSRKWLQVSVPGLGIKLEPIPDGPNPTITVRYTDAAQIEVTLSGYEDLADELQVNARVASREWDDWTFDQRNAGSHRYEPDAWGRVQLGSWEATPVWLILDGELNRRDDHWRGFLGAWPLELKPEPNSFTIAVPQLHSLSVRFPFEVGGGQVQLRTVVPYNLLRTNLLANTATWRVPPGEYTIRHSREGEMRVVVQGDTEVEFEGTAADRLLVTIIDPSGYLARIGLRTGDAIIEVDGEPMSGYAQLRATGDRIASGGSGALGVDRSGVRLAIELQPALQVEPGKIGGRLQHGLPRS